MADLKASPLDRLYLVGAIHRMGERTGAAAERILDDHDTLLAENARLQEVAEAARHVVRHGGEARSRHEAMYNLTQALAALEAP